MKNYRLIGFSTLSVLAVGAFVLGACSSDDTSVTPSGDGGPETSTPIDGGGDSTTDDAATDAKPDVGDVDAGLKLDTFAAQVADAMCNTLARCCYGSANLDGGAPVDGGSYDRTRCIDVFDGLGFENSLSGFNGTASKAKLNQAKGAECLAKIQALTCNLGGPEYQAVRTACFDALEGTQAAGQACQRSIDCAPGNYCNASDGGAGTCAALAAANGDCAAFDTGNEDTDLRRADEVCSYRGSGAPKLFCDSIDLAVGIRPRDQWKCAAAKPNGSDCANSLWCSDGICNPDDLLCTSPLGLFPQSFCSTFVNP